MIGWMQQRAFARTMLREQGEARPIITVKDSLDARAIAALFKDRGIGFQSFSVPGRGHEFFLNNPSEEPAAKSVINLLGIPTSGRGILR